MGYAHSKMQQFGFNSMAEHSWTSNTSRHIMDARSVRLEKLWFNKYNPFIWLPRMSGGLIKGIWTTQWLVVKWTEKIIICTQLMNGNKIELKILNKQNIFKNDRINEMYVSYMSDFNLCVIRNDNGVIKIYNLLNRIKRWHVMAHMLRYSTFDNPYISVK